MKEVKYYCDECGEEVKHHNSATVIVLIKQGIHDSPNSFDPNDWDKIDYARKGSYSKLLCPKCLGTDCKMSFGSSRRMELGEKKETWLPKFLKKIGFIKKDLTDSETIENSDDSSKIVKIQTTEEETGDR